MVSVVFVSLSWRCRLMLSEKLLYFREATDFVGTFGYAPAEYLNGKDVDAKISWSKKTDVEALYKSFYFAMIAAKSSRDAHLASIKFFGKAGDYWNNERDCNKKLKNALDQIAKGQFQGFSSD